MTRGLDEGLRRFAARHGLGRTLGATAVVAAANAVAGGRFQARSYRDGILRVIVRTPAERYRLEGERTAIAAATNARLGREAVQDVRIRIERENREPR